MTNYRNNLESSTGSVTFYNGQQSEQTIAQGTWIYAMNHTAQQQIKHLIAGKTIQEAVTLLSSLSGVEQAAIRFTGFGDNTRLPKNIGYIHVILIVV